MKQLRLFDDGEDEPKCYPRRHSYLVPEPPPKLERRCVICNQVMEDRRCRAYCSRGCRRAGREQERRFRYIRRS